MTLRDLIRRGNDLMARRELQRRRDGVLRDPRFLTSEELDRRIGEIEARDPAGRAWRDDPGIGPRLHELDAKNAKAIGNAFDWYDAKKAAVATRAAEQSGGDE